MNQPDLFGSISSAASPTTSAPVRRGARDTEKAAARSVNVEKTRRQVAEVMKVIRFGTHEQLIKAVAAHGYTISDSGVRTRCKELHDAGLVIDTERKVMLESGRASTVWAWHEFAQAGAA